MSPPEASASSVDPRLVPFPLVDRGTTAQDIDEAVCRPLESFPTVRWWIAFAIALAALGLFGYTVQVTVLQAVGTWGINNPVFWGFAIINLVFWIGIGHAGTLISAILFLFRQTWRTAIARFAEAITLFAVLCAVQFPTTTTSGPTFAPPWNGTSSRSPPTG